MSADSETGVPTVLNVNDHEVSRYVVSQMLRSSGFAVIEAVDGESGLALARNGPDAIVLDVRLPDISGYEVCRRLKAAPETRSVPVLLTSAANVDSEDRVEGLDAGADAYLIQPFESAELSATLRALLRIRSAERAASQLATELGEAVRIRDEFLSIASHELKTPLTSLQLQLDGLLGILLDEKTHGTERMCRKVETAIRQVDRLTVLVDDLLDVSRITQGQFTLELDEIDLERITLDVVERFAIEAARAKCPIEVHTSGPVTLRADAFRLEQVIANLVSNAIKYGCEAPVEVELSADEQRVRIAVRDHGIGIATNDRERIFERFERAVSINNYGGLGLGLFISRQIVEAHRGAIHVETGVSGGTVFIVDLPREQLGTPIARSSADRTLA